MADTLSDWRRRGTLGASLGVWLILAAAAAAQQADSRWAPWVGCWRAVDETDSAPVLCVVPGADGPAIDMLTIFDGQVVSREPIVADGQQHEVSRDDCEGWEQAEFSDDARRIYVRSELGCGAGSPRSSTGVISMVSPFEWLDVRTVVVDGQSAPWVGRYRAVSQAEAQAAGQGALVGAQGSDARMARMAASIPIAPDDVIEAAGKVSAETVQLWVVERAEAFALDATTLIEMADAGVPPNVIDVVVAVSYPEKFVINEGGSSQRRPAEDARRRSALGYNRSLNPFADPFYDPYGRYGYRSFYGSRFGYGFGYVGRYGFGYGGYGYGGYGLGYGYGYGGYGTPIVVVGLRGSSSRAPAGRVVRGGGYTSARGSDGSTGRTARPRSSGSGGSPAPAARSARPRSGSSGGGVARSAAPRGGSAASSPRGGRSRSGANPRN